MTGGEAARGPERGWGEEQGSRDQLRPRCQGRALSAREEQSSGPVQHVFPKQPFIQVPTRSRDLLFFEGQSGLPVQKARHGSGDQGWSGLRPAHSRACLHWASSDGPDTEVTPARSQGSRTRKLVVERALAVALQQLAQACGTWPSRSGAVWGVEREDPPPPPRPTV